MEVQEVKQMHLNFDGEYCLTYYVREHYEPRQLPGVQFEGMPAALLNEEEAQLVYGWLTRSSGFVARASIGADHFQNPGDWDVADYIPEGDMFEVLEWKSMFQRASLMLHYRPVSDIELDWVNNSTERRLT